MTLTFFSSGSRLCASHSSVPNPTSPEIFAPFRTASSFFLCFFVFRSCFFFLSCLSFDESFVTDSGFRRFHLLSVWEKRSASSVFGAAEDKKKELKRQKKWRKENFLEKCVTWDHVNPCLFRMSSILKIFVYHVQKKEYDTKLKISNMCWISTRKKNI